MSPEDALAALLREEGDTIVPSSDGLQKIQQRVAARRRTRWVLPGALAATAAAAAFAFVLSDSDDQAALHQVPATAPPTPVETTGPTSTPTAAGGLDHPLENPAIWPFTSSQQIARWKASYPYATDKTALVQHYLTDVLKLDGAFVLTRPCESCDVVDIALGGHQIGQAALERFDLDGERVYTISTLGGSDLTVLSPDPGGAVRSPTRVRGRITGVDENVTISLVTQDGKVLGTAGAPAGSAVAWEGSVSWTDTDWTHGQLVLKTFSMKDGTLNRLTVVPVICDAGSPPSSTPAALRSPPPRPSR